MKTEKTITGDVDPDVLEYTVGDDPVLDMDLVRWDCLGTAAHVTMLSEMPVAPTRRSSCASRTRTSTWP